MRRLSSFLLFSLMLLLALLGIATPAPLPLAAQVCSNDAEVIGQTVAPASSPLAPGAAFVVTWDLRNSGDCTWDRSYRLIFSGGERMGGPRTIRLSYDVAPGNDFYAEMDLTTPSEVGSYSGTWRLRDGGGDSFGPEWEVAVEVSDAEETNTDVVLPEVLVFGGAGGGGYGISQCLEDGSLPASPTLLVDEEGLSSRHASLVLCSFSEGAEITVTATNPLGESFVHTYVQYEPESDVNDEGTEYTGTLFTVDLFWITHAPSGDWRMTVTSSDLGEANFYDEATINVPEPSTSVEATRGPYLEIWPDGPIDPFLAAEPCEETIYRPGEKMLIGGAHLSPKTTVQLGFYQNRYSSSYLMEQIPVQTGDDGSFTITYDGLQQPGYYDVVVVGAVDPTRYLENGTQYMGDGPGAGRSCLRVSLETAPELPLRLAYVQGDVYSGVGVFDLTNGDDYGLWDMSGQCISSEPAWWPGEKWLLYQSNCKADENGFFVEGDYDLYASLVDRTNTTAEDEALVQLTETPDLDETGPDANSRGDVVFRQAPSGAPLDQSGALMIYETATGNRRDLELYGRAPVWSPDGGSIAFMSDSVSDSGADSGGSWQIYFYDVDDDILKMVSTGCATQCSHPAWSPDGKQLIYEASVSLEDLTPAGLWIAPVDGSRKPRRYLVGEYSHPSWSSEKWIAFQGPDGIYRATLGSKPVVERYLYSDPTTFSVTLPVWSH